MSDTVEAVAGTLPAALLRSGSTRAARRAERADRRAADPRAARGSLAAGTGDRRRAMWRRERLRLSGVPAADREAARVAVRTARSVVTAPPAAAAGRTLPEGD